MPTQKFEWGELEQFKAEKRFLDGYPQAIRNFYAPQDDVRGLLTSLLQSAQNSLVLNMYGYDDEQLDAIIRQKLKEERVYVQISLDSIQAGGKPNGPSSKDGITKDLVTP